MAVKPWLLFFCFDVLFCTSMCAVGETDSESKVGFASVPGIRSSVITEKGLIFGSY